MKTVARLLKTKTRRVREFVYRIQLLEDAIKNIQQGNAAYYITLLSVLRTLLCSGKGNHLLQDISDITGKAVIVEVCFLDNCEQLSLKEYLSSGGPFINGREYTRQDFIWELASQDGSHADETTNLNLVEGELLNLGGMPANIRVVLGYAIVTLKAAQIQLKELHYL